MDTQELKKAFFSGENKFFNKKTKSYENPNIRNITKVFSSIASKNQYREIRKRYKMDKILSKILLPKHMHYVLYSFYRKNKLTIAVPNHIGQSELNLQKMNLIRFLKVVKEYENISEVSIFRDEKFSKLNTNTKKAQIQNREYDEQSYGIFENNISDKRLFNIMEKIRQSIKKN